MRRAFLEQHPQIITDNLRLMAQSPVPDSLHYDAVLCEESVTFSVVLLLCRLTVLETIRLHNKSRFGTEEIERVFAEWMLATKLVTRETLVAEHFPEELFSPRRFFTETSGAGDLGVCWRRDAPHPGPLPLYLEFHLC